MEKRIELEKRGIPAAQIKELNLDNCRSTQIEGLTDEFKSLVSISLNGCGLTSLKGFPSLPNLRKLELSDNRISSGLNLLQGCPKLSTINLSGNKIKDIASLEPLKELPELHTLDLFSCDVNNVENYREKVFELLTGLEYLDGFNRKNEEADDGDDDEDGEDDDDEDSFDEDGEVNEVKVAGVHEDDDEDDDDDDDDENDVGEDSDDEGGDDEDDDDDDDDDEDGDSEDDDEAVERGTKRKHEDDEDDNS